MPNTKKCSREEPHENERGREFISRPRSFVAECFRDRLCRTPQHKGQNLRQFLPTQTGSIGVFHIFIIEDMLRNSAAAMQQTQGVWHLM